jgi:predicted transcriptional regulator
MLTSRIDHELDLLERHLLILRKVIQSGPIGIIKLSEETGIPDHRVRYSLRVLEQKGLIAPSTHGAVSTKAADQFLNEFESDIDKILEKTRNIKEIIGW